MGLDAWVAVAIGLNLPPHHWRYRRAVSQLARLPGVKLIDASSPIANAAVGSSVRGRFLNGAAAVRTRAAPRELLARLKRAERALGRRRGGDRPADFDIIAWFSDGRWRHMRAPDLTLPHPRAAAREFVLRPLSQLTPPRPWPPTLARALARVRA